jgi:nickel-dependent lactate racemase
MPEPTELHVGVSPWTVTVLGEKAVELRRTEFASPTTSPVELTRSALEKPFGFEPLRRALTPDDHITIVLDATVPHVADILGEVLAHLRSAYVKSEAVTILTSHSWSPSWASVLVGENAGVQTEVHDPTDRNKLAYLASTKAGRRLYLNRTLVEADFVIVLSGLGYDPFTGYSGAETAVFPALADAEVLHSFEGQLSSQAPGTEVWPARAEAMEVVGLLGTLFFVQVIAGTDDTVQDIIAGLPNSWTEARKRQDQRWRCTVSEEPDTVIAAISGKPERVTFLDLAKAASTAARVVRKGGRIAVLTTAAPDLGSGAQLLRSMEGPTGARKLLAKEKPDDWAACFLWAFAAKNHSLFLASGYPDTVSEELFATPIHTTNEVQRLVDSGEKVLLVPDAHKTMVTIS